MPLAQLFLNTSAVMLRKIAKSFEKLFSSSENAIWPILFKYHEIDVQIQTFTDKTETSYIVVFLPIITADL